MFLEMSPLGRHCVTPASSQQPIQCDISVTRIFELETREKKSRTLKYGILMASIPSFNNICASNENKFVRFFSVALALAA